MLLFADDFIFSCMQRCGILISYIGFLWITEIFRISFIVQQSLGLITALRCPESHVITWGRRLYLGVSIFRGRPKVEHLVGLADSVVNKFSRWKGHTLSLAGRRCLINNVIAASLVHSMMVYKWPRPLLQKVESAMWNFLWPGNVNK